MGNMDDGGNDFIQETVKSILEEEKHTNGGRSSSINKVHSSIRNLHEKSFIPRKVCIGPLHRNVKNLQAFEGQKAAYVFNLLYKLKIKSTKDKILEECVEKVKEKIDNIKACYEGIDDYGNVAFAKMMVMDACFILEFAHQIIESFSEKMLNLQAQSICYDLVLLENQIPFFVLKDTFECTLSKIEPDQTVIQLIGKLLTFIRLFETKIRSHDDFIDPMPDHILGLLHTCYGPKRNRKILSEFSNSAMHSAVELDRAGVKFRPNNERATWVMEMKVELHRFPWYWGKPTLRMPVLCIHHFTESVLRNLIAYEQSSRVDNYFTSYAMAMDMLVNTQEDIAKLVQSKVLVANLSSNEVAADMMNNICKEVPWEHFFYDEEWKKLDKCYNRRLTKSFARLKRIYFSSPWNIIALLAGIVLFVLTMVQTIFTIKSAY